MRKIFFTAVVLGAGLFVNAQENLLNENGNIGIGTRSPGARLQINSNAGNSETFNHYSISDAPGDYFRISNGTGVAGRFSPAIFGHSQNAAIGGLSIIGSTIETQDISNSTPLLNFDARRTNGSIQNRILFGWSSYGQRKMIMTASGNLGLGTTAPKEKFQIGNGFSFHDGGHKVISFVYAPTGNTDLSTNAYASEIRFDHVNGNLRFGTSSTKTNNPTTNMTITKNGYVGLGTTSPLFKMHLFNPNGGAALGITRGGKTWAIDVEANGDRLFFRHTNETEVLTIDNRNGGSVNIGTRKFSSDYKLSVAGKIQAEEIKVHTGWADYVFKEDYKLPTLAEVAAHIEEKGHLINIPSEAEVLENGIHLGAMNAKLLEKIEELTLYTLEQEEKLKTQEARLQKLETLLLNK